jgi:small-conductance mechanosensitive channel
MVVCVLLGCGGVAAQETLPASTAPIDPRPPSSSTFDAKPDESQAESVARLGRIADENQKLLKSLQARVADASQEYAAAQADFERLDDRLRSREEQLAAARDSASSEALGPLELEVESLRHRRKLARDRFDLAIEQRTALLEQLAAQEERVGEDREALAAIGQLPPVLEPASVGEPEPAGPATAPAPSPSPAPQSAPPPLPRPMPTSLPANGPPADKEGGAAVPEVRQAQDDARSKEAEAQAAEQEVRAIEGRIDSLRKSIDLERRLLETANGMASNAQDTVRTLTDEARTRSLQGATGEEMRELWTSLQAARERSREAREAASERAKRLDRLHGELQALQGQQLRQLQHAAEKRRQAGSARRHANWLQNPFAPQNVMRHVAERGPRILVVLLGMFALRWVSRVAERRAVPIIAGRGTHGDAEYRQNRARTLVGVLHNAASLVIYGGGILMVIAQLGIDMVPLMGGVAVAGLAVAFGAQNLIRDYFYGFMILLENQYTVNDVVKIGAFSGRVERITLRITVLRDLDGTVHFIPNGQINAVSNMTHEWSRAMFEIRVGPKQDVNRVMEVLMELAQELRNDPNYRSLILDSAEMLGVDAVSGPGLVIKFYIKTRPTRQWRVKRELLRRIKLRFDELGIEML